MTKIAGLDYSMSSPGLTTYDTETEEFKFYFYTSNKKLFWDNEQFFGTLYSAKWKSAEERFNSISDWAIEILKDFDLVILEGYSYNSKGVVFHIGENTGLLKHKLWKLNIPYEIPAPKEIKKFAAGNGNANKKMMEEAFTKETGIDIKLSIGQRDIDDNPSSDIADSYFLVKWGLYNRLGIS